MRVLVTGGAGFIGSNLIERLLKTEPNIEIVNLDSVNDYYDVKIKEYRLSRLEEIAKQHEECKYIFVMYFLNNPFNITQSKSFCR